MKLQKVISRRNCVKKFVLAGILKVNDENSRTRIRDPDPLVRCMDPRIRIRIHPKMSWIRHTGSLCVLYGGLRISKLQFSIQKIHKKIYSCKFFKFLVIKPLVLELDPDPQLGKILDPDPH